MLFGCLMFWPHRTSEVSLIPSCCWCQKLLSIFIALIILKYPDPFGHWSRQASECWRFLPMMLHDKSCATSSDRSLNRNLSRSLKSSAFILARPWKILQFLAAMLCTAVRWMRQPLTELLRTNGTQLACAQPHRGSLWCWWSAICASCRQTCTRHTRRRCWQVFGFPAHKIRYNIFVYNLSRYTNETKQTQLSPRQEDII